MLFNSLPRVLADLPVGPVVDRLVKDKVQLLPWDSADPAIEAIYTYGHPPSMADCSTASRRCASSATSGVGVDHIDVNEAARRGIPVGNTPGILDGATADLGFALLLAVGRRVVEGDRYARGPNFLKYDPSFMLGREIHHSTLGIVGMGRIGEQVARRARGFDMTVLYHNRKQKPGVDDQARYVPLDTLLAESDYVMLTVPLTAETTSLIGREQLGRMKPKACLINIARGPVVDLEALTEALKSRRIAAAALDVTQPEPLPRDHPILALDNVIITPHLGSASEQTRERMAELSVENLLAGLTGQPLRFRVEPGSRS